MDVCEGGRGERYSACLGCECFFERVGEMREW